MEERYALGNDQVRLLQEQNPDIPNKSTQRNRIMGNADMCFRTLMLIQDSKYVSQEFKDKIFIPSKVNLLINKLTEHNPDNTNAQEINKQEIILDMIQKVFEYYKSRYSDQPILIKQIKEFSVLAKDLKEVAEREKSEDEASIMYRNRGKMPNPPLLFPERDNWTALCTWCHKYSARGKNESEAIKQIKHTTNCAFHKEWKRFRKTDSERVIWQFFRIIPPKISKKA